MPKPADVGRSAPHPHPDKVLMLGVGWFPSQLGGLNRYFRGLLGASEDSIGLVIGPAEDAIANLVAVGDHSTSAPRKLLTYSRTAWRLMRDAEVVDVHFALFGLLPAALRRRYRYTLLIHFHGPWAAEASAAGTTGRVGVVVRHAIERYVYRRADVLITLTAAFKSTLVAEYGVSPWKVHVIPPGVDRTAFRPAESVEAQGVERSTFQAVCVRRLLPRMGVDVLLRAWSKAFGPDPQAQLSVVGVGPETGNLQALAQQLGLSGNVRFHGRLPDAELAALYNVADVNVVPSVALEGFGLTVLEAASCGTPSLVTDVAGLPAAVRGLGARLVVPASDPEALAERLRTARTGDLPSPAATVSWAAKHDWGAVAKQHRLVVKDMGHETDRPRVVYLCHTSVPSGAELSVKDFLEAGQDVDPYVICAEPGPLVDRLVAAGIPAEVMPLGEAVAKFSMAAATPGITAAQGAARLLLYGVRLGLRLRRIAPDLVQANSLKSGIYGAIAARMCGVPLIWGLHDRLSGGQLPAVAAALMRRSVRFGADAVICNSRSTLDSLGPDRGGPRRYVIPPATNLDGVLPHVSAAVLRVGIVGRITPWKGQDVFLRAFAESFKGTAASGAIIGGALFGSSDEAFDRHLRELASQLGIGDQIVFRGHQAGVWRELSELDILVHASTHAEPFGRVIIEGMAAGVPVIAANAGGPSEIITDGHDGLLFTQADPHALAACLNRLGSDPQLRAQLAGNAHFSVQRYSVESVRKATREVYADSLLTKHSRSDT